MSVELQKKQRMILEIRDILERQTAYGHINVPRGMTLGQLFDADKKIAGIKSSITTADFNGVRVDNWQEISPAKGDKVRLQVMPKPDFGLGAMLMALTAAWQGASWAGIVMAALTAVSVGQFVAGLFMTPKPPKLNVGGVGDSPTYGFEGIQTTMMPGNPVPVIYGMHRVGGQLLSMATDVASVGGRHSKSSHEIRLLLGLGEGPITDVNCVKINGILSDNFPEINLETRTGGSSQAPITGFEKIRNTFRDGREITSAAITYTTNGNSLSTVDLQIAAQKGMYITTVKYGGTVDNMIRYSVERKPTGTTTYTVVATRDWSNENLAEAWDIYKMDVDTPAQYDVRLTWLAANGTAARDAYQIWLMNVTENTDMSDTYSGTALLAIKGIATANFQGGRPDVTALVRGRTVRAYSDDTTFITTWTRNPAWCVLDYMTNSVYGMGAWITNSDVNMQSYIDFATLCNSLVPNGAGGTEAQHMLDLVMDVKKPHWSWVLDTFSNYRSSLIYSQMQWKVISDRADQPLRQIFHSGNMVPGRTVVKMGSDPLRPNQANVRFANQNLEYEQDVIYVQNSGSIYGAGDPIKDFDMSMVGVVRESEAIRNGDWQLNRKRQVVREVSWATGLEALAVEPGDMARVGIKTYGDEMGVGGRVLEGDVAHITLDREIVVSSGYTYDLFLWHAAVDSMESRTLANTVAGGNPTAIYIVASPTAVFAVAPAAGDRWAIGITSEDLMLVRVKSVGRNEGGQHELMGEQFLSLTPVTPILSSTGSIIDNASPPAQPISVVATEAAVMAKDGSVFSRIVVDVGPHPPVAAGQATGVATTPSFTLQSSHTPVNDALNNENLRFFTGAASGYYGKIGSWRFGTAVASVVPQFITPPNSGDRYQVEIRNPEYDGFDLFARTSVSSEFSLIGPFLGTRAEMPAIQATTYNLKVVPFSRRGIRNYTGNWLLTVVTTGDVTGPGTPSGLVVGSATGKLVPLNWNQNSESDLDEYLVYRNTLNAFGTSSLMGEVSANAFFDSQVTLGNTYYYWIRAIDCSSNFSPIHPGSTAGGVGVVYPILVTEIDTTPPVNIDSLTVIGSASYQGNDGMTRARVDLGWVNPTDTRRAFIDVLFRRNGDNTFGNYAEQTTVASARVLDLTPGVSYDFAVRGVSKFGILSNSTFILSNIIPSGDMTAPGTPAGLSAIVGTGKAVELVWIANSADADLSEYRVHRNTANLFGTSSLIAETRTNKFIDANVTLQNTYFYWIRAVDFSENISPVHPGSTAGIAAAPVLVLNTEVDTAMPTAPVSLTLTASASYLANDGTALGFTEITWSSRSHAALEYHDVLYRRANNPDWIIGDQVRRWVKLYGSGLYGAGFYEGNVGRIDDLSPNITYDYGVRAVSKFSVFSSVTALLSLLGPTDITAPAAPTGLAAVTGTGKSVSLDWGDNSESDFDHYEVYRNTSNAYGGASSLAAIKASRFVDVDVTLPTTYYYWVRAVDRTGNISTVHPDSTAGIVANPSLVPGVDVDTVAPTALSSLSIVASVGYLASDGAAFAAIGLAWINPTDANRAYVDVLYRRDGSPEWLIGNQTITTSGRIDDIATGISYNFGVRAVSRFGVQGSIISVNGQGFDTTVPATPSGLAAIVGTGKLVELVWSANADTDLDEYRVNRNTANAFGTSSLVAQVQTNKFLDSDVTLQNTYFYWVRAEDRSGNISPIHPGSTAGVVAAPTLVPNTEVSTTAPSALGSLTVSFPENYLATDGTAYAVARPYWVNPADTNRAYIDVLYKRSSASNSEWQIGNQTITSSSRIDDLSIGVNYDFGVRAVSRFGVQGAIITAQSQTALDTTVPATPTGLVAAIGTGRQVLLDWSDNTEADLAYYELYRHTANLFGGATKIVNANVSRFTDVVSAFETPYFYWVRAADRSGNLSPIHPGSTAGVTIAASMITTPDISSSAITDNIEAANDGILVISSGSNILSATIQNEGGPVIVIGKFLFVNSDNSTRRQPIFSLRRGTTIAGNLLDNMAMSPIAETNDAVILTKIDNPGSGSVTYSMWMDAEKANVTNNMVAQYRRLQLLEVKR